MLNITLGMNDLYLTILVLAAFVIAYFINRGSKKVKNTTKSKTIITNSMSSVVKNQNNITIESLSVSSLIAFLIAFAHQTRRFEKVKPQTEEELVEIMVFYLFAVDLELFGKYSNTEKLTTYREELYSQFLIYIKIAIPDIDTSSLSKKISDRFSFYASSYNKMMKPNGNSAQMTLDLRETIPRVGRDLWLGLTIYNEFMDIFLNVDDFLKNGIPKEIFRDTLEKPGIKEQTKWYNMLPSHLKHIKDINRLEYFRVSHSIDNETFSNIIASSPWATKKTQYDVYEKIKSNNPEASEKDNLKMLLRTRLKNPEVEKVFGVQYTDNDVEEMSKKISCVDDVVKIAIDIGLKYEPPDDTGLIKKIYDLLDEMDSDTPQN